MTGSALALLGLAAPYSPVGVSLGMALLLLAAGIHWRTYIGAASWREPVMAAGLALFAWIAVHSLVVTGWTETTRHAVNHYQELVLAPLLLAAMARPGARRVFFRAFITGCTLLAVAIWISKGVPRLHDTLLPHRISSGFALAIAAFLLALLAPRDRLRPVHALAAALAATVLFGLDGRTGQLVLLLLAACLAWHVAPARWRWGAAVAVPLLLAALAITSTTVQGRIAEARLTWRSPGPPADDNSTGVRIELLRITSHLALQHPLMGVGFGNYPQAHRQAAEDVYAAMPGGDAFRRGVWVRTENPHDEFLMQWIGGGVVALGLFLAWLAVALATARRLAAREGAALAGITLAFALGCVFNSMLFDFMEAHLYAALLAWVIAEGRHPARSETFERILVVATRQIGDVLLTTPLIRRVRTHWPHAHVGVLGLPGTLGMLRGNPDVDELLESPPGRGPASLLHAARLWRRWDLALVTDVGDRAHLAGWVAAPLRSGVLPAEGRTNRLKRALLAHAVVAAGDLGATHVVQEKQALLAPWDAAGASEPVVPPPASPLPDGVAGLLQPRAVVVHAPSMWSYKQWPTGHFVALVRGLLAMDLQVVLTGSASERDRECIAPLRGLAEPPRLLDLSGRLDFNQLVTLLGQAALYVGPDTSVSHLAAATGVPVLAIFGPTNPQRWAPWPAGGQPVSWARVSPVQRSGNVTLLQGSLACVPCGRAGCDNHRHSRADCLPDIAPERALAEARKLLEEADARA